MKRNNSKVQAQKKWTQWTQLLYLQYVTETKCELFYRVLNSSVAFGVIGVVILKWAKPEEAEMVEI